VFRTVYVLGHPTLGPRALIRAAALACPGAVISHRSAATLLGLREVAPAVVDLIPPIEHGRRIDGIKAHRVPYPGRSEARRAAGLPMPRVNAPVRTAERVLEVDLLWPEQRFVVEADSRRHHAIEVAFERDRRRDRELLAAGYGVLRVTWREAEKEPDAVLAVISGLIGPAGPSPRSS
jgi:hypothetical protein